MPLGKLFVFICFVIPGIPCYLIVLWMATQLVQLGL